MRVSPSMVCPHCAKRHRVSHLSADDAHPFAWCPATKKAITPMLVRGKWGGKWIDSEALPPTPPRVAESREAESMAAPDRRPHAIARVWGWSLPQVQRWLVEHPTGRVRPDGTIYFPEYFTENEQARMRRAFKRLR